MGLLHKDFFFIQIRFFQDLDELLQKMLFENFLKKLTYQNKIFSKRTITFVFSLGL